MSHLECVQSKLRSTYFGFCIDRFFCVEINMALDIWVIYNNWIKKYKWFDNKNQGIILFIIVMYYKEDWCSKIKQTFRLA